MLGFPLAPHFFGDFPHQGHFRPLLLFGELVADFAAGEAALRRQAQVLKRYVLRRFVDAGDDGLLILKLGAFRGDGPAGPYSQILRAL